MGGRGASSMSGSRGSVAKGSLILPDGSAIEFDGELRFDGNDKAITGSVRAAIESWENKRVKNKIEYARAVDENGNYVGSEAKGSSGSCKIPSIFKESKVVSHNHPREAGILGGTFSSADLIYFSQSLKGTTMRATSKEGTYSISKGKNFNANGFSKYVSDCQKKFNNTMTEHGKRLKSEYYSNKIDADGYMKGRAKAFNNALISLHNDYRSGQKQYGYTYTLEGKK